MPTHIYIYIHTGIYLCLYIYIERDTHIRMHTHIYSGVPPHTPALDSLTYCLKESLEKTHKELSRHR